VWLGEKPKRSQGKGQMMHSSVDEELKDPQKHGKLLGRSDLYQ